MLVEVPRSDADTPMLVVGNPVKMSRLADGPIEHFPRLGQHTDEVLEAELGLSAEERAGLRERGVVG